MFSFHSTNHNLLEMHSNIVARTHMTFVSPNGFYLKAFQPLSDKVKSPSQVTKWNECRKLLIVLHVNCMIDQNSNVRIALNYFSI